jgi:hypothetical protein
MPPEVYPLPKCAYVPKPLDVSRMKKIKEVLDTVIDPNEKTRVTVFVDNGDVVKLLVDGCGAGVVSAWLWTGYSGYSMNNVNAGDREKKLIQRSKIVTRLIFQDPDEIARIDKIMDAGHFLPPNRDKIKSFSDQTQGVFIDLQQPSGDEDALINILYESPPLNW